MYDALHKQLAKKHTPNRVIFNHVILDPEHGWLIVYDVYFFGEKKETRAAYFAHRGNELLWDNLCSNA